MELKNRRALSTIEIVLTLIVSAVVIVVGAVVFTKNYTVLNGLRDSDFTAAANSTITGVSTDFWSGLDLTRLLLIIIPAGAILGAIVYYLMFRSP